jgi:ATP:ADP antiporter, AAA family
MFSIFEQLSGRSRRDVIVAFVTLCLLMAAHTMLETARDALFLTHVSAARLPIAYLAMAIAVLAATRLNALASQQLPRRRVLTLTLVIGGVATAAFYPVAQGTSETVLFALYVWPGVLTSTALVQLWLRLHAALDVERAKPLYAMIGAGGMLGASLGSAAATALAEVVSGRALLLGAATLYVAAGLLPLLLPRAGRSAARDTPAPESQPASEERDATPLHRDRYARMLVALMFATAISTTLVDYLFKSQVAANVPAGELASFFGRFYTAINILALCAQLLLLPWLLRRYDVHRAVMVLPFLLALFGLGASLQASLVFMLALRGVDGVLRHSLFGTASEIFYLPLASRVRDRLKGLAAGVGQRGGQAAASLLILATGYFATDSRVLSVVLTLAAAASVVMVFALRRGYVARFRERLRERVIDLDAAPPKLELTEVESLLTSLSSPDAAEVVAALDLLHVHGKDRLVPAFILHHPAKPVVLRALDLYARERSAEVMPLVDVLLDRREPEIRAAALRAACMHGPETGRRALARCADDENAAVRVTCRLAEVSLHERDELSLHLRRAEEQIALARGITLLPPAMQSETALGVLEHGDAATRLELARALARAPREEHFDALLRLLEQPATRELARMGIERLGERAVLPRLEAALRDPNVDLAVRLHLPRTISRFTCPRAARFLSSWLEEESDERVAFKVLRGLGRMRADRPRLPVNVGALRKMVMRTVWHGLDLLRWRRAITAATTQVPALSTPGAHLCLTLLDERLERAVERAFRLLHILMPRADFSVIHSSWCDDDPKVRAVARELLRHTLPRGLRAALLALLNEHPSYDREAPPERPAGRELHALELALAGEDPDEIELAYRGFIESLGHRRDDLAAVTRSHAQELADVAEASTPPLLEEVMHRLAVHASPRRPRLSEALL